MNTMRKHLALLLLMLFVVSLSSCGIDGEEMNRQNEQYVNGAVVELFRDQDKMWSLQDEYAYYTVKATITNDTSGEITFHEVNLIHDYGADVIVEEMFPWDPTLFPDKTMEMEIPLRVRASVIDEEKLKDIVFGKALQFHYYALVDVGTKGFLGLLRDQKGVLYKKQFEPVV